MDTVAPEPAGEQRPAADAGTLVEHLIHAQELERQRLAERIHDDPMQALVAVGLRMQLLASRLPADERDGLDELNDAVSSAMGTLRGLLTALRPRALDHERLGFILEAYLEQATEDWDIEADLDYRVAEEPASRVVLTIFRVVQAALENVRRYARATTVVVKVSPQGDGLLTEVRDNGRGWNAAVTAGEVQPADTDLGLLEMRERVLSGAGWWELASVEGAGSMVRFWLPLRLPEVA